MKKILIVAEIIGSEDTSDQDSKIVNIVREFSDENEVHVYAKKIILNDAGDYLRMKGLRMHTQDITLVTNMPQDFDVVIAMDAWAVKMAGQFDAKKKIRLSENSKLVSLSAEINKKETKK
jgi:hypothetical protein